MLIEDMCGRRPAEEGTAAVAQEGREICDFDELVRRCGGIAEVAERVLKKFLDKSGQYLQDIENAVSKANSEELTAQSHKLKGVAANLAAHTVRGWPGQFVRRELSGSSAPRCKRAVRRAKTRGALAVNLATFPAV